MKIKFSRHAKRRAKLYKISEDIVIKVIRGTHIIPGKNQIIKKVKELSFPLKIVYRYEDDELLVITNYPLKKEKEK